MAEVKALSFDLDEGMLGTLRQDFDIDKLTTTFAEAIAGKSSKEIEDIGKKLFSEYGQKWIKRARQLRDEFPDRTYEAIIKAIEDTNGYYKFSLLPQSILEVAYLGAFDLQKLHIVENNHERFIYMLEPDECPMYDILIKKCSKEVVGLLPCKHACLTLLETLHRDLELDAIVSMEATMPKDGYCRFVARRA